MELGELMSAVQNAEREHGPAGRRITIIYHPRHGGHYDGVYGGAPVLEGPPGYRFNDGELVTFEPAA